MGKIKRLGVVVGVAGSMFVALFACSSSSSSNGGGGFSCSSKSPCPNDKAQDTAQCQKALSDPSCGSKYQAFGDCAIANVKCGADGKTDSNALAMSCQSQEAAYLQCVLANPGDAGGGG
jgi:hypothetical protein